MQVEARLEAELAAHVDEWLGWVAATPLLDEDDAAEVAARDTAVRPTLRGHQPCFLTLCMNPGADPMALIPWR